MTAFFARNFVRSRKYDHDVTIRPEKVNFVKAASPSNGQQQEPVDVESVQSFICQIIFASVVFVINPLFGIIAFFLAGARVEHCLFIYLLFKLFIEYA